VVTESGPPSQAVAQKQKKAERYANEQDRFCLASISAVMRSEHGDRLITFDSGTWRCSCEFFARHDTCSHVMSLEMILRSQAGIRLAPDEPEKRGGEPWSR
jgi:hypothetical protein